MSIPPIPRRDNPPGLDAIIFRPDGYAGFLARMLARLPRQTTPENDQPPLARINLSEENNWIVALLESWAMVQTVLAFYQERIINEGYWQTATEQRSMRELARALGHEPRPHIAARTWLAFTLQPGESGQLGPVRIPQGTAAQSLPQDDRLPQLFTTQETIQARSEWNTMLLARSAPYGWRDLRMSSNRLRLLGQVPLKTDDAVLIVSREGYRLVTLTDVRPDSDSTVIEWLSLPDDHRPLRDPEVYSTQQIGLFPYTQGGVYVLDGDIWSPVRPGLPNAPVNRLLALETGTLVAATERGLYTLPSAAERWQARSTGLLQKPPGALDAAPDGEIYAGGEDGVIVRSSDGGLRWVTVSGGPEISSANFIANLLPRFRMTSLPKTTVQHLRTQADGGVLAITDDGLFRSRDRGESWYKAHANFSDEDGPPDIHALARHENRIYAATDKGVYELSAGRILNRPYIAITLGVLVGIVIYALVTRDNDLGASAVAAGALIAVALWGYRWLVGWLSRREPEHAQVQAVCAAPDGTVYYATDEAIFVAEPAHDWLRRRLRRALRSAPLRPDFGWRIRWLDGIDDVQALYADARYLLAGLEDGRVLRSTDGGSTWADIAPGPGLTAIADFAALEQRIFAAGAPVDGGLETGWYSAQMLDLDRQLENPDAVDYVVLAQDGQQILCTVERAERSPSLDSVTGGAFTRASISADGDLSRLNHSEAAAYVTAARLTIADDHLLPHADESRQVLVINRPVRGLMRDQRLIVSGQSPQLRTLRPDIELTLMLTGQRVKLPAGAILLLRGRPEGALHTVETLDGLLGTVSGGDADWIIEPAAVNAAPQSERVQVESVELRGEQTVIRLQQPLRNIYDRRSVVVYGNVAPAAHGNPIPDEILGSGDGSRPFNRFNLNLGPLLYDQGPGGLSSSLQIRVDGMPWEEHPTFAGLGPGERAYVVRQNRRGASIIFGDGHQGAALTSGSEQVQASYRVGRGSEGNLPPHSIAMLRDVPYGVTGVTNPIAAAGGADREATNETRRIVPQRMRALERIVSLSDYRDFALNFAGVEKVDVQMLQNEQEPMLVVTVAARAESPQGLRQLIETLNAAIIQNRLPGGPPVQVHPCEILHAAADVRLVVEGLPEHERPALIAAAELTVHSTFAFERRQLGQGIMQSELIAVLQGVAGVRGVLLDRLELLPAPLNPIRRDIGISLARYKDGVIRPAQLLLLDRLQVEVVDA